MQANIIYYFKIFEFSKKICTKSGNLCKNHRGTYQVAHVGLRDRVTDWQGADQFYSLQCRHHLSHPERASFLRGKGVREMCAMDPPVKQCGKRMIKLKTRARGTRHEAWSRKRVCVSARSNLQLMSHTLPTNSHVLPVLAPASRSFWNVSLGKKLGVSKGIA